MSHYTLDKNLQSWDLRRGAGKPQSSAHECCADCVVDFDSYGEALAFLNPDAGHSTDDDLILTLARGRLEDSRQNLPIVRKAVEIISKERDSATLNAWLKSAYSQDSALREAYLLLGIEHDDPSVLDDDIIMTTYLARTEENSDPARLKGLQDALSTIADRRSSSTLKDVISQFIASDAAFVSQQISITDPRGIRNIGNTCYLNSLLQYFFTVKPVRELVDNFEQTTKQVLPQKTAIKTVGGDEINQSQITRARNCKHIMGSCSCFPDFIVC